ncbi:MAG: helix-turn-helix transcriptional regulator [Peptococcaceae bacterium]|jgi:putative molybdopterin biosynthesis protein|nr:helix-turn-helix transcriptional regulator [Peptococcaceae bacterium]
METTLLTAEDVAKQLKIKKYTVYELIKRGELPSSKVGKQVRVSQTDINEYLRFSKETRALPFSQASQSRQTALNATRGEAPVASDDPDLGDASEPASVIICGQDLCLDLLVSRISAVELGSSSVLRSYMGSYNGLYALYYGKVSITAAHLWDSETDSYNYPFIRRLLPGIPVGVLRLAGRRQGFYVTKGNPLNIQAWQDLARPDITLINREKGSGTRILLDQKLDKLRLRAAEISGYKRESTSHLVCASTVAKGGADVGCGCEYGAANIPGVDFIPLQLEWYDLVFRLSDRHLPAIREILSYVPSAEFKSNLEMMGGYDLSQTGYYEEF